MRVITLGLKTLCTVGSLVLTVLCTEIQAADALRVAVAANFRPTAEILAAEFQRDTGTPVTLSSASTGVLAAQLRHGAPFDLLLAADRTRPAQLAADQLTLGEIRCYARGNLVLLGAHDQTLKDALAEPGLSIAIANPRSAPYGAAALEVLSREDLAHPEQRRVVMGTNVQQAFQFWHSGATDLALVAGALADGDGISIPATWHEPIEQFAAISANSRYADQATAFMDFLTGARAEQTIVQAGFEPCP